MSFTVRNLGTFVLCLALMSFGSSAFAAGEKAATAAEKPAEKKDGKPGCDKCNHGDKGHKCEKCADPKGHSCGKDCGCKH